MMRYSGISAAFIAALLLTGCHRLCSPGGRGWDQVIDYGCGYAWMSFVWILFIIAVGAVGYFIVQKAKAKASGMLLPETPLNILKRRYAGGEITKEEYDRIKHDLEL